MNKHLPTLFPIVATCCIVLLLGGCAQKQDLVNKAFNDKNFENKLDQAQQDEPDAIKEEQKDEKTKVEVLVDHLNTTPPAESVFKKTGTTDRVTPDIFKVDPEAPLLNFEDAKLYDVIYSLCELLGVNFIIDPSIKDQSVTINMVRSDQKLKTSQLLDLLLKLHDLTIVNHDGFISVVPIASPDINPGLELLYGTEPNKNLRKEEVVMQIVPLKFVSAAEINGVLKEFLSPSARVYEEPKNNVLIIIDKYQHISKAMELIPIFDIDVLANKKMVYYQLAHVDAAETGGKLTEILSAYGFDQEGEGLTIVNIETLNGLLIVAPASSIFKEIDFWIKKFDQEGQTEEEQVFVYKVENTTAGAISATLSQIFDLQTTGGSGSSGASSRRSSTPNALNNRNSRNGQDNQNNQNNRNNLNGQNGQNNDRNNNGQDNRNNNQGGQDNNNANRPAAAAAANPNGEGPLMIVDEDNNSLIFSTTHREYARIYKTLRKLDVLPRQVFLEVTVLSVELNDSMDLGLNWGWNPRPTVGHTGTGSTETLTSGFNDGDKGIFNNVYTYQVASGLLTAQVTALKKNGYANLLQQPHIMAIDNQSASISVGADIPIQTSTTNISNIVDGNGSRPAVSSNIQYRSTGVSLSFTPHINANGVIRLEISLDISDPGNVTENGAPPINSNSLQTEMIVRDNQTVVMGGLILDQESWNKSTVPLLGRIPIIKHLFTDRSSSNQKSELVVMITPRLVDNEEKSIAISKEFKEKILKEFEGFKKSRY